MKPDDIAQTLNDVIVALVHLKTAKEEIDAAVYRLLGTMPKLRELEDADKPRRKRKK